MDIQFDKSNIANAINKLKKNSAAGPDGVPAIFLINTKDAIKKTLQIIVRTSIDEGVIPNIFKLAYITPIHKGGSKLEPANYRPISLTSHIMKIFKRLLKTYIVKHLEKKTIC